MAVGFASYEIARSGLSVSERGLFVTGHNISNVNTPGYSRQQAIIATGPYQNGPKYQVGFGADIQQIRQIRHSFLDNIYRKENTTLGYWESRGKTFEDIQSILSEPIGAGLQDSVNQFWNSWQELSKHPDSLTVRALVLQRGEALVHQINHLGTQIDKLQNDFNEEIRVRIDEVNQITAQIAKLNTTILKAEVTGDMANDFRDQRNLLVDRLTKLVDPDIYEMQDGQISVSVGGYFLVSGNKTTGLYAGTGSASGLFYTPKLEGSDIEVPIHGGILRGLLESRGEVLEEKGSYANGAPNTKADITIVIDTNSSTPMDAAYVSKYIDNLKAQGIDCNVNTISVAAAGFPDITAALDGVSGLRQDAGKYALVFTDKDTGTAADINDMISVLNTKGMKASAITGSLPTGWATVASETGGKIYTEQAAADYDSFITALGEDTGTSVNEGISEVEQSQNILPDLKKRLNGLVNILAREVNYLHRSGKTLGDPPTDGQDFFTVIDSSCPLEMGNIKLNDIFSTANGLNNIAASMNGASGDNTIAQKIANLRHMPLMKDTAGTLNMDEYYQSIILGVGHGGAEALSIAQNQMKLVESADLQRQSISAVSMDEEMANMMKYKYAYNASSRAINVIDEMIETIINRMGLAGR